MSKLIMQYLKLLFFFDESTLMSLLYRYIYMKVTLKSHFAVDKNYFNQISVLSFLLLLRQSDKISWKEKYRILFNFQDI